VALYTTPTVRQRLAGSYFVLASQLSEQVASSARDVLSATRLFVDDAFFVSALTALAERVRATSTIRLLNLASFGIGGQ